MRPVVESASVVMAMSGGAQPGGLTSFLPFAIILAIFYFLILMPMQRRQKKVQEFQSNLKVGDKIVTTSGIYGQITRLNDNRYNCRLPTRSALKSRGRRSAVIRDRTRS
jgi:preprotein translocase subunit YajC